MWVRNFLLLTLAVRFEIVKATSAIPGDYVEYILPSKHDNIKTNSFQKESEVPVFIYAPHRFQTDFITGGRFSSQTFDDKNGKRTKEKEDMMTGENPTRNVRQHKQTKFGYQSDEIAKIIEEFKSESEMENIDNLKDNIAESVIKQYLTEDGDVHENSNAKVVEDLKGEITNLYIENLSRSQTQASQQINEDNTTPRAVMIIPTNSVPSEVKSTTSAKILEHSSETITSDSLTETSTVSNNKRAMENLMERPQLALPTAAQINQLQNHTLLKNHTSSTASISAYYNKKQPLLVIENETTTSQNMIDEIINNLTTEPNQSKSISPPSTPLVNSNEVDDKVKECKYGKVSVCGTLEGRTRSFANICELMLRNVFLKQSWTVMHTGDCNNTNVKCSEALYEPICVSRNNAQYTLANECYLKENMLKDKENAWKIVHKGECEDSVKVLRIKMDRTRKTPKVAQKTRQNYQRNTSKLVSKTPFTTSNMKPIFSTIPRELQNHSRPKRSKSMWFTKDGKSNNDVVFVLSYKSPLRPNISPKQDETQIKNVRTKRQFIETLAYQPSAPSLFRSAAPKADVIFLLSKHRPVVVKKYMPPKIA